MSLALVLGRLARAGLFATAARPRKPAAGASEVTIRKVGAGWITLGRRAHPELALAAKHALVSILGFAVDLALLRAAMAIGLEPAWARVISLGCAMQATFVVNGCYVFRCLRLDARGLAAQWLSYLVTNAFGNLCNYWIFVTLVSLHHPVLSRPASAVCLASLSAWGLNYGAARLLVFGAELRERVGGNARPRARPGRRAGPSPGAPGSARR